MKSRRLFLTVATMTGAGLVLASPAAAASGLGLLPTSFMIAGLGLPNTGCAAPLQPALGSAAPAGMASASKAQAILGGQMSRLEMIASQQSGATIARPAPSALAAGTALPGDSLTPGAGGSNCQQLVLPSSQPFQFRPGLRQQPLPPEDFLASKRLPVSRTAFDAQWKRVSHAGVPRNLAGSLARSVPGDGFARIAAVNAWTNANIRFVDDRVQYRKADYWAGASATLRRRAGDCEDIAITKLQLLAALGVPRSDMYLTIARDLARNADHALLVVRQGGKFWLLDNATSQLLDASQSYDYRPILSYSESGKWLHGY